MVAETVISQVAMCGDLHFRKLGFTIISSLPTCRPKASVEKALRGEIVEKERQLRKDTAQTPLNTQAPPDFRGDLFNLSLIPILCFSDDTEPLHQYLGRHYPVGSP